MRKNKIFLSIDLDEWYHTRWCTGTPNSRWKTTQDFFREYYGQDRPIGELIKPTEFILETLKEHQTKATFFILGEIANYYPDLVRKIFDEGHEIACHGYYHQDLDKFTKSAFIEEVSRGKKILEAIIGKPVVGFRAPNAVLPPYLIEALLEMGFEYDSSVFPARKFLGKYGYTSAPLHPYHPAPHDFEQPADSPFWEFPVAVYPKLRMLAGSGIFTRIFGYHWSKWALQLLLRNGDTAYYFHPYETDKVPLLEGMTLYQRIFLHGTGKPMQRYFIKLLKDFEGAFTTGVALVSQLDKEDSHA